MKRVTRQDSIHTRISIPSTLKNSGAKSDSSEAARQRMIERMSKQGGNNRSGKSYSGKAINKK